MPTFCAWLRGINVGKAGAGRKSVPMAELRALAEESGCAAPRTHVQSGNLVFRAKGTATALADELQRAIATRFGFEVPVTVSTEKELRALQANCPFPAHAEANPQLLQVAFCRRRPSQSTLEALAPYRQNGEEAALAGHHLWIWFPHGVGRSKLTPAVLDRAFDAPVTARNAKTLAAVVGLLES